MKEIWKFIKYSFYIFSGSIVFFAISYIFLDFQWKMLILTIALSLGGFIYLLLSSIRKVVKSFEKEPTAKYYDDNLKEAKRKLKNIRSLVNKMPSQKSKMFSKTYDYMKQIYMIVEKKPSKYSQARSFFNEDIDNTLKIIENYSFIIQQPTKSIEMKDAVVKTEKMLNELEKKYELTIHSLLTQDVATLDMELDYLKNTIDEKTNKH